MKEHNFKTTLLSLGTVVLLSITGCSNGSSGGSDDSPHSTGGAVSYSGTGIDGILVGSTVCVDVNQNNACDTGEPSAITDENGKFTIPQTTATGPLVLIGGVDNSTGEAFTGSLKAPAGSEVVTPLTSAIQSLVEGGKSPEDAEANIKAAMGLTNVDVNLTTFDPYNEVSDNAKAVLAKQTQLQVLVHSATVTVAGADAGTDVNSTMSSVFDALVENFDGATAEVTLDASSVAAATKTAADSVYASNAKARVAAKVVAQTSAENSVRDADSAKDAIEAATNEDAAAKLDAAIAKANTSAEAELRQAAQDAAAAAAQLTAEKIAEIEALQRAQQEKEAEIAAAKAAKAAAEAELAAAKAAAEADAADRAKYEAFLKAQAAAEKAAREKAEADLAAAQAAQAAAEQEKLIAAEAAQREAEAEAAAAQAAAQAAAAQARENAAKQAEADARAAADLAAAQAAAQAAQEAAAAAIAQAEVNTNVQVASFYATQAAVDANKTQELADLNITGNLIDANATTARNAAIAAAQAASDANITIPADHNVSASEGFKNEAIRQAGIAAAALEDAYRIKGDAELAAAAQIALNAKIARITAIKIEIAQVLSETNATFNELNASKVANDVATIATIATTYPSNAELQSHLTSSQTLNTDFQTAYAAATSSKNEITAKLAVAQNAIGDVNETAAIDAKVAALVAKEAFQTAFTTATQKADELSAKRVSVEAIRDTEIANQTAAIAAQQALATAAKAASDANISILNVSIAQLNADIDTLENINTTADLTSEGATALAALQTASIAQVAATQAQLALDANLTVAANATTLTQATTAAQNAAAAATTVAAQTAIVVEQAAIANAALVAAQAKAANVGGGDANVTETQWGDGKVLHSFRTEVDNGDIKLKYSDVELSNGQLLFESFAFDQNSSTWVAYNDSNDMVLQSNGNWSASQTETYVIDESNASIMTINGSEEVKLVSAVSLSGQDMNFTIGDTNITIPVTFSDNAVEYTLAFRQVVDEYRLDWTPRDYQTGAAFTTLEEYMLRDGNFYWDENTNTGVEVQRNANHTAFVDQNNNNITTLSLGQKGNLITWNQEHNVSTVVGEWEVVHLPNQTALSVKGTLDTNITNYDGYMQYGQQFATLYDDGTNGNVVRKVELRLASSEFMMGGNDEMNINTIARDDIKNAINGFTFPTPENPFVSVLKGKTLWSQADGQADTLVSQTFNADASELTWAEVVVPNTTCNGSVSVVFESNNTMTLTVIDENCTNPTPAGTTFNSSVVMNDTWNYILVDNNKWYFNEQDARNEFLSPSSDLDTYIRGNTLYYIEQIDVNYLGQAALYNFDVNGSLTGVDAGGAYDDGVSYEVFDNNISLSNGIVFNHLGSTADNKGQTFAVLDNGSLIGDLVLYADEADRNAVMNTEGNYTLAGERGEVDAPSVGLVLRLTQDGNFDTNDTGSIEHGTYTFEASDTNDGFDGNISFTQNDDSDSLLGLFRGESSIDCTFTYSASSDQLDISCPNFIQYSLRSDYNAGSGTTNAAPVIQNDIYLTMLVGESLSGIISASDADLNDTLTFTPLLVGNFGAGTELNATTGAFTIVAGTIGQAQITVRVSDEANASDEMNVNINVIAANPGDDEQGNYSRSAETLTLAEFNAATTVAIPGDTTLHSFWGINDGRLVHDTTEFNTTSFEVLFSDSNDTIYFTNTLSTGEVNASKDGVAYDAANQIAVFKLLEIVTDEANLSAELNITMPNGSIAYKTAVMMTQDELDFWDEVKDFSQDQNGTPYTSLAEFMANGWAAQDHNNWNRALIFDQNNSGNLIEVDLSGYFQTQQASEMYVINPNAGTWEIRETNVSNVTVPVLYINPSDTQRFGNEIYVFDDFGVQGSATNTVWQGELRVAGNIEISYDYNDIAAQAILDTLSANGVLVDPYIVGATLCEDLNTNGTCDQGEQLSSVTGEDGGFTFGSPLTPGSHIIIAVQGTHEGKTYDLDLGAVVDANGHVEVVSPMTTFVARGLTTQQLAEVLNKAATDENASTTWSISAADILSNPLENGVAQKSITTLNDADFVALQASMASYGILKIMEGSSTLAALSGNDLYVSGTTTGGELNLIARAVLNGVSSALNKAVLESVNSGLVQAKTQIATGIVSAGQTQAVADAMVAAGLPEPKADLVIKMAVVAIDRLATVGYETCNATTGSDAEKVTAALSAVGATFASIATPESMMALGQTYYGLVNADTISTLMGQTGMTAAQFGAEIEAGLNGASSGATTFRFSTSNTLLAE